ncbi:MAG: type II secretion system secretin GspD [Nitrospirae bacterium]|nr:type II secretion system secretin GspD [Nitrospirota bacterium]
MKLKYFLIIIPVLFMFLSCSMFYKATKTENDSFTSVSGKDNTTADNISRRSPGTGSLLNFDEKKKEGKDEEIPYPVYEKTSSEKLAAALEPIDYKKLVTETKPVMINVDGMPLSDFIIYAVGDALKVTFFIDEAVKALKTPVTIRMTKELPPETVLEIVVEQLRQNGLLVGARGPSLYILKPAAIGEPTDVKLGRGLVASSARIVQVVPLSYVNSADIVPLIGELYKTSAIVKNYHKDNSVILIGTAASMKDILNFIEVLDVPYLNKKKIMLMKLVYWKPEEFVTQMASILAGTGVTVSLDPKMPGVTFIPIKFLNSVLAISPDDTSMELVMKWKNRLDTSESAGAEEKIYVYTPRFSMASELVDSIQRLYGLKTGVTQPKSKTTTGGLPSSSSKPAAGKSQTDGEFAVPAALPKTAATASTGLLPTAPGAVAPEVPGLKITADDKRNAVLMMASPSMYRTLLGLLKELDTPPRQVSIEATVAELTLDDENNMGFEWYLAGRMLGNVLGSKYIGPYTLGTLGNLGVSSGTGLSYSFTADTGNLQALISMLAKDKKVEILSKPHLMVLDNEEATIQVGNEVPVITSEVSSTDLTSTSSTTPSVLRNVQYRSTGVILTLKPTINSEGLVTVDVNQEVSEADTNTTSSIDSPLILKRSIHTKVVVSDGNTVVLGGMRSKSRSHSVTKIPFLGDIPILGYLFKADSASEIKTELIILITPKIIHNTEDATSVTKELREGLGWFH